MVYGRGGIIKRIILDFVLETLVFSTTLETVSFELVKLFQLSKQVSKLSDAKSIRSMVSLPCAGRPVEKLREPFL